MELTPAQWMDLLESRFTAPTGQRWQDDADRPQGLVARNKKLDLLWSYFVGDPPLPKVAYEYQDIFKDLLRKARSNYAEMCVTAVVDRLELLAVSTDVDDSANGDDRAAELMEESGLAAQLKDAFTYLCALGESYMLVMPGDDGPTFQAIDPRRCIGVTDPKNPIRLRAALIRSYDVESRQEQAHLYLPGKRWLLTRDGSQWRGLDDTDALTVAGLDGLGGIPIVRFENKLGLGEYEAHVDVLDRIIDTTLSRLVLSKFQAFRQRGVSGDEPDDDLYDDESEAATGDLARQASDWGEVFKAGPGAVWKVPAGWQFWESQQADMQGLLLSKRDDVKEFAAVTHTPLYLITPDDANGSAAGAGMLREALTCKVRDRRARVTPALKLLWRIAFAMDTVTQKRTKIRLHWGPIELNSLAEKGSASAQSKGVLSRRKILSEVWEMDPQDIEDNETELAAEAILTPTQPGAASPAIPVTAGDAAA